MEAAAALAVICLLVVSFDCLSAAGAFDVDDVLDDSGTLGLAAAAAAVGAVLGFAVEAALEEDARVLGGRAFDVNVVGLVLAAGAGAAALGVRAVPEAGRGAPRVPKVGLVLAAAVAADAVLAAATAGFLDAVWSVASPLVSVGGFFSGTLADAGFGLDSGTVLAVVALAVVDVLVV